VTITAPYCTYINTYCVPVTAQIPQSIMINMSLTSAVGSLQGGVTNVNFCSTSVGSVFTLTR
jgi:hypothetical protein